MKGWSKIYPGWTCEAYLKSATGPVAGFFHWLGSGAGMVRFLDQVNIWGLLLIGLALMLGVATRLAACRGIAVLALYYCAYPPLFGPAIGTTTDGHYLLVNHDVVEMATLWVVVLFPAGPFGLAALLSRRSRRVGTGSFAP